MSETADETTTEIAILVEHDEQWTLSPAERKYYVTLYPKHLAVCLSLRFFSVWLCRLGSHCDSH